MNIELGDLVQSTLQLDAFKVIIKVFLFSADSYGHGGYRGLLVLLDLIVPTE